MTYTFKLSRRLAVSRGWHARAPAGLQRRMRRQSTPRKYRPRRPRVDHEAQIEVFPDFVYAEVNQPIQLQARARLAARQTAAVSVEWTANGGRISPLTASSPRPSGSYKVVGRGRGKKKGDTTTVVVGDSVPDVVALVLTPDTASLEPDQSRQFDAQGKLSDGSLEPTAQCGLRAEEPSMLGATTWQAELLANTASSSPT